MWRNTRNPGIPFPSVASSASRITISKRYIQCKGVLTMSHGIRLCSKRPSACCDAYTDSNLRPGELCGTALHAWALWLCRSDCRGGGADSRSRSGTALLHAARRVRAGLSAAVKHQVCHDPSRLYHFQFRSCPINIWSVSILPGAAGVRCGPSAHCVQYAASHAQVCQAK